MESKENTLFMSCEGDEHDNRLLRRAFGLVQTESGRIGQKSCSTIAGCSTM